MRARLLHWIDALRTGFWFVPSLMLFAAAGLAIALLRTDVRVDPGLQSSISWAYSGGPEGARSLLSTIAGSMITAASVTFSLASVALSIASQQYGSRVLRNFMRDRVTQILLGTFVSTFLYCVLVVRAIRGSDYSGFVPAISITVGIALALVSLLMLIYFVHHVSRSIQASHIVSVIADDIQDGIPKLYPKQGGAPAPKLDLEGVLASRTRVALRPEQAGYLQTVDMEKLMRLATRNDLVVEVLVCPGDHLVPGQAAASVWTRSELSGSTPFSAPQANDTLDQKTLDKLREAFGFGKQRGPEQDIRYPFQQLTDVIVRALSPGINDPFTAVNGIDELATGLTVLAGSSRVEALRRDEQGALRIIAPAPALQDILTETVGHIAIYAAADSFVCDRLRRVLAQVQPHLASDAELRACHSLRDKIDRLQAAKAAS